MGYEPIWLKQAPLPAGAEHPASIAEAVELELSVLRSLSEAFVWSYLVTEALPEEGYEVLVGEGKADILGGSYAGVLYGIFDAERQLLLTDTVVSVSERPASPLRMLNHWDNADGSIERG